MALKHPEVKEAMDTLPRHWGIGDMNLHWARPVPPRGEETEEERGQGVAGAGMGAGLAAAGMAAAGTSGGRKKCKKEGGALLTLQDMDKMHGQSPLEVNAKITAQAKPYNAEQMGARQTGAGREVGAGISGAARKRNARI